MSNKHEAHSRANTWEQVITVAVTLVASIVAMVAGAPDKWLAAIFCTVVTFGGIISFFKEKWASRRFWVIVSSILVVHLVLTWVVFGMVLRQREDVGLLTCLPFIFVESFLLYQSVRALGNRFDGWSTFRP